MISLPLDFWQFAFGVNLDALIEAMQTRINAGFITKTPLLSKPRGFRSQWCFHMVRVTGLEPAQPCDHKNLNLTRLPIPPHPHI